MHIYSGLRAGLNLCENRGKIVARKSWQNHGFRHEKAAKLLILSGFFHDGLWSWWDSNPRPHKEIMCFLHAYSSLRFSCSSKTWTTNYCLIPKSFTIRAGPQRAISDLSCTAESPDSEQHPRSGVSSQHLVTRLSQ